MLATATTEIPALHPAYSHPAELLVGDARWHVAEVQSRHEKALAETMLAVDVGYFLPLEKITIRTTRTTTTPSGKPRQREDVRRSTRVVFPGYVFFAADADKLYRLKGAWLRQASHRITILDVVQQKRLTRELTDLHIACDGGAAFANYGKPVEGQWCSVASGPFEGLSGTLVSRDDHKARVVLQVSMMDNSVAIEVDADAISF